jgi:AcrR family transcriptional regulator
VPDTPSRLRDAAERLLAERPPGRISLRDITEAAGANVAAVGYHFGSKDALLDEVVRRALTEQLERQRVQLAELGESAGLEAVVRAWVLPGFGAAGAGEQRRRRMMQNALLAPSPGVAAVLAELDEPVRRELLDRLGRLLPDLSPEELAFRHAAVLAAAGGLGGGFFGSLVSGADPKVLADRFVAWVVGGLVAPPAGPPARKRRRTGSAAPRPGPS